MNRTSDDSTRKLACCGELRPEAVKCGAVRERVMERVTRVTAPRHGARHPRLCTASWSASSASLHRVMNRVIRVSAPRHGARHPQEAELLAAWLL